MWRFLWNHDPGGNVDHIAQHGLSWSDVESVFDGGESRSVSNSTGYPCAFGYTFDGRYILVIFEQVDARTIYPITAYEVPEPNR